MATFFWQKGFYFNSRLFFFDEFTLKKFKYLYSFSFKFLKLWEIRCEGFDIKTQTILGPKNLIIKNTLLDYKHKDIFLNQFSLSNLALLNTYLPKVWPILYNIRVQLKFNMWFYYLTRTYRGISLKINKPLHRRTRKRTYYKPNFEKPKNIHRQQMSTNIWFR
jgi:hypothetical protein